MNGLTQQPKSRRPSTRHRIAKQMLTPKGPFGPKTCHLFVDHHFLSFRLKLHQPGANSTFVLLKITALTTIKHKSHLPELHSVISVARFLMANRPSFATIWSVSKTFPGPSIKPVAICLSYCEGGRGMGMQLQKVCSAECQRMAKGRLRESRMELAGRSIDSQP